MRRMIDPKTIGGGGGGGGSIQLYRHHIHLFYSDNYNNYGHIYLDYDSTNAEQFTADTLIIAMEGKPVICNGYLFMSRKKITISITSTDNQLQTQLYDIEEKNPGLSNFNISKDYITIEDQVYLIN